MRSRSPSKVRWVCFSPVTQAIPTIMSGRECIAVAKTGSGKTLAYLLPLFRHILDQPPVKEGEGPIGLIFAPARELVAQIYTEASKFCKILGIRITAVYGGTSMTEQINSLKRGSEIIVCTPGRMIDILCLNQGRLVGLQRVSYIVLDEADRMLDMGFEPQISRIVENARPDRQLVMFSATFPSHVENLARRILNKPVMIIVGGRTEVAAEVAQTIEVRTKEQKFPRLLQILGEWYDKGLILIFVDKQQKADYLFRDLLRSGYYSFTLHGGMDQQDRDQTIADFKNKTRTILIATSVAGRGLHVNDLVLVINYDCPNHLEDYVGTAKSWDVGASRGSYGSRGPQGQCHHVHHAAGRHVRGGHGAGAEGEQDAGAAGAGEAGGVFRGEGEGGFGEAPSLRLPHEGVCVVILSNLQIQVR